VTSPAEVRSDERIALYRLHDAEGVLLYVGITSDPDRRFAQHAAGKHWWPQVVSKSVEWYPNRGAAEAAEEAAIQAKNPKFNVVHCNCPPEFVTIKLPQATVRGLGLFHRQFVSTLDGPPEKKAEFKREDLIEWILMRELSARGLYGDPPCWHDGFGWPDGVTVQAEVCGCGRRITREGHLPPGERCGCADEVEVEEGDHQ